MSYRKEMAELVQELHNQADKIQASKIDLANDPDSAKIEKLRRQAQVLDFIITHPEQIGEIFNQQEEQEKEK
jgi:hypothetical protein